MSGKQCALIDACVMFFYQTENFTWFAPLYLGYQEVQEKMTITPKCVDTVYPCLLANPCFVLFHGVFSETPIEVIDLFMLSKHNITACRSV